MADKEMSIEMGGEVASFIEEYQGKLIKCFGVCKREQVMDSFVGYKHDGGLSDARNTKWWVYFECPKCRYGHSFAKMNFFLEHTEREIQAKEHERKFAEAMESIPVVLAENAGLDPIDILTELRSKHEKNNE